MAAPKNDKITQEELMRVLSYDSTTGEFRWVVRPSRNITAGAVAGCLRPTGYLTISYGKQNHLAHRLAWLYVHGQWPVNYIDHINGNRSDNRIENLRDVSMAVNIQNLRSAMSTSKCGLLGVGTQPGRFVAKIFVNGKMTHLGSFRTADAAHAAYLTAKREMHEGCQI
jgi:hypothetical protein